MHEEMRRRMREEIRNTADVLGGLMSSPVPTIGIDIDGCVDEAPIFFQVLSKGWQGRVVVVSFRSDREKAEAALARYHIRYDELVLVDTFEDKAELIKELGILVFFDDQPEALKSVASSTNVMLVRNAGNFDFEDKRWKFTAETGKIV